MARSTGTANLAASLEVLAGAPLDARTVVPTVSDLTVAANFPYKYVGMPVVTQDSGDMYILTGNDVTDESNWKKLGSGGGGLTQTIRYNIVTKSTGNYDASITVNKYVDDELESSTDYLYSSLQTAVVIDHRIQLQYYSMNYHLTLLADSTTEQAGYTTQWAYNATVDLDQYFISEAYKPYVVDGYYKSADHLFYEESTYTTAIPGKVATIYVDLSTSKSYRYDSTNQIFVRLDEEAGTTYTAGDGIDISNDEISTDNMPAEDMSEIVSPLPGVMSRMPILFDETGAERVVGWYKYSNGTKKPVYEKCIVDTFDTAITDGTASTKAISLSALSIDKIVDVNFINTWSNHVVCSTSAWPTSTTTYEIRWYYQNNELRIVSNRGSVYESAIHAVVRYTKTTDTAS